MDGILSQDYGLLAKLGVIALMVLIAGFSLRRSSIAKAAARGRGTKGGKEKFFKGGLGFGVVDGEGEVWQDNDLAKLKDGKEQGVYRGDKGEEKDDWEYESWDKY